MVILYNTSFGGFGEYFGAGTAIALILLVPICSVAVYRLCFHPLAGIPGPRLAAISQLYEFYYNCIKPGQYTFQIQKLHQIYGPIVRINPWEVHIDDPEFFDQLYNTTLKLDKDPWYYRFADGHLSAFGTADADLHRMRRGALNRYFSTASIRLLDPLLEELFEKLSIRVEDHRRRRLPMPLGIAFRCFTADTVTEYSVPRAPTFLDARDYAKGYHASTRSFLKMAMWNRHFGFIIRVFSAFPRWFVAKVDPDEGLHAFDNLEQLKEQASVIIHDGGLDPAWKPYPIVLNGILNSNLPACEKTHDRLWSEALTLLQAGTETSANTLCTIFYHLLLDPTRLRRLHKELVTAIPNPSKTASHRQLERLPFLNACINEGLRVSSPISGRLPRINREHHTLYRNHVLLPGTVISMTTADILHSHQLYPYPKTFLPERWLSELRDKDTGLALPKPEDKYFVPFGKGSRNCIGMPLAMAELYVVVGNLVRRFGGEGEMSLWETSEEDVVPAVDFFGPFGPQNSTGLKVTLRHEKEKEISEKEKNRK